MIMELIRNGTSLLPSTQQQEYVIPRRKRRRASGPTCSMWFLLTMAACSAYWYQPQHSVEAFGIRKWVSRRLASSGSNAGKVIESERLFLSDKKTNGVPEVSSTWSKPVSGGSTSPLQVRKRVRAVLEKARTRTGVDISSALSNNKGNKPSNVVAEAASIGGLGDEEEYIIELKRETNGATLAKNGKANGTSSPPAVSRVSYPDDVLMVVRSNGTESSLSDGSDPNNRPRKSKHFDVIRGDVPAAAQFCEPLPFELPKLSKEQLRQLQAGERVQEQARMGREGSGYVVVDVKAPPYVVWECLLDFEDYPSMISTVKEMQLYTSEKLNTGYVNEKPVLPGTGRETRHYGTPSVTRAAFVLSKFRLNIAAVHKYSPHPDGDYMIFTLDKSCTNMVLKGAKGIWHTVANPDGREGYTRVYLLCEVQISRALPTFIVDYTADRAMPRATTWLKPYVEDCANKWLSGHQ